MNQENDDEKEEPGMAALQEIKKKWMTRLESGEKIVIEWDAGGDETPVSVSSNGIDLDWEESDDLVEVVIDVLDLPNAGEYFVQGQGELLIIEGKLMIKHESHHTGAEYAIPEGEDFDPERFDFEEIMVEIDKKVSETIVLIP